MLVKLKPLKVDLDNILYNKSAFALSNVLSQTVNENDFNEELKINAYSFW